jgi:hypothetical protein
MPATPSTTPAAKASQIDALRQQLTDADRKRRTLLVALFLQHPGDTTPLVEALISAASLDTLNRIESMLSKGGV